MLSKKRGVTIAIQKDGRLTQPSLDFIAKNEVDNNLSKENSRLDYIHYGKNTIIFLKYGDILPAVVNDIVDCGIIGSDILIESSAEWDGLKSSSLHFAKCRLALAVKDNSQIKNICDLQNKQIATKFPLTTKLYLDKNNVISKIYKVQGSCEVFSYLNFTDAIVDIVETGKSLKAYNMKVLEYLMNIEAILIYKDENKIRKLLSNV